MKKRRTNKEEGNLYDKVIKENLTELMPTIFRSLLNIRDFRMENLPEIKQQTTLEVEPDFLRKIFNTDYPNGAIVQVEFESFQSKKIIGRLLEYLGILYKKHELPVLQFVIILQKGNNPIKNKLVFGKLSYEVPIIYLDKLNYRNFVNGNTSEEVILAILSDFDDLTADQIIELILNRLIQLNENSIAIHKFIKQLSVLSRLRKLQQITIKKANDMLRLNLDIKEDELFNLGQKEGLEKGLQKGLQKGKVIQIIKSADKMLASGLSIPQIANFLTVNE